MIDKHPPVPSPGLPDASRSSISAHGGMPPYSNYLLVLIMEESVP